MTVVFIYDECLCVIASDLGTITRQNVVFSISKNLVRYKEGRRRRRRESLGGERITRIPEQLRGCLHVRTRSVPVVGG
jgi:hypothetical protein